MQRIKTVRHMLDSFVISDTVIYNQSRTNETIACFRSRRILVSMAFSPERKILITSEEIASRIANLAQLIARDFLTKESDTPSFERCLMLLCVLQSALPFAQALQYELYQQGVATQLEFINASSYGMAMESSGKPVYFIADDLKQNIAGKDILVVKEIDRGTTLDGIVKLLQTLFPKSLNVTVLLKKIRESADIGVRPYIGLRIPDLWVDGFGIDSANHNRELKDIWAFLQTRTQLIQWAKFRVSMIVAHSLQQANQFWSNIGVKPL